MLRDYIDFKKFDETLAQIDGVLNVVGYMPMAAVLGGQTRGVLGIALAVTGIALTMIHYVGSSIHKSFGNEQESKDYYDESKRFGKYAYNGIQRIVRGCFEFSTGPFSKHPYGVFIHVLLAAWDFRGCIDLTGRAQKV